MGNFFENLNDLFSTWAKGLQDSQKQNQQNQGAGASAPSFESVGSTLLGGIGDAVSSAWKGFLNKAQESNKQNIQAGNYTTNPETVHLESPFGNHDNLMEKATAKPEEPKKKNPWEYENPFNDPILDDMYAKTVFELDEADPDMKQGTGIMKDAYDLTTRYAMDVFASDELLPEKDKRDPLAIAEKGWRDALDGKKAEYAAFGKSGKEIEGLLQAQEGWQTEKQHRESQEKNVISAAMAKQNGDAPYSRLAKLTGDALEGKAGENTAREISQALEELGDAGRQAMEFVSHLPYTQAMGYLNEMANENLKMSYEEADKYLREANPMYSLAKDTQGQMDDYAAAYGDLAGLYRRGAEGGYDAMTPAEQYAYHDLSGAEGFEWLFDPENMGNPAGLSEDQLRQITDFGQTRAQQMEEAKGLFSPYEMTPYQQGLWEQYVNTPEGAAQWAEDAKGTKDEEKARDNLYFVTQDTKYKEYANRPDYEEKIGQSWDYITGNFGDDMRRGMIWDNLTEEEKQRANAVAAYDGKKAALDYLDYMQYTTDQRINTELETNFRNLGENGVWGGLAASAFSVPASLARGAGYIDQAGQEIGKLLTGKPVNRNSAANMLGTVADSAREGVQNQVDWNVNILGRDVDVFDFLYGTVMSGIDSFTAGQLGAALGGIANSAEKAKKLASWTGAAILGTGAAQSAMQDAYDRGANDGTALLLGAIAGANETLWEHWSIGNLIKHGQDVGKKTFAEEIKNAFAEAGVNASEEFNTSVANGIAEYFLNHDGREVQKKADEYERLGLSPEAALEKARGEFWASAVMDAAGGALMGGVFGSVENVQNRQNVNRVDKAVGSGFSSESMDTLYSLAESEGASDKAKKLARKFPKEKANAKQIGELFRELSNTMGRGIKEALHSMGVADIALQIGQETGAMDKAAAEAVTAMMQGENLNGEQVAAIAANPAAMKIVDALFKPDTDVTSSAADAAPSKNTSSVGSAATFPSRGRQNGEGLEPVQFEPMPGMEMPGTADTSSVGSADTFPSRGRLLENPVFDVKTVMRGDESAAAQRITDISEDEGGGVRVKLEDGQTVDLEDAGLSAPMQEAAQVAAGMEDKGAAAALMNAAQEVLGKDTSTDGDGATSSGAGAPPSPQGEGLTADADAAKVARDAAAGNGDAGRDFAMGFRKVYEAAKAGKTLEDTRSIYADQLGGKQRQAAYEAGKAAFDRLEEQARQRNLEEAKAFGFRTVEEATSSGAGAKPSPQGEGLAGVPAREDRVGVLFDHVGDGLRDENGNADAGKVAQLRALDMVAKKLGFQVRAVDGLEHGANAKYVSGTNIVYINLNAEENALTKAVSHEGFHFISEFSPEWREKITNFVMDRLGRAEGYDIDQRIKEVQAQYNTQAGQELTPEEAREEIVADSMLDVIGTEENMKALFQEDKGLAQKIKDWVSDTYAKLKEILNRLAKNSPEAKALKDDVDYIGRIRDMWEQGVQAAAEAYRQSQHGLYDSARTDADVQQYTESMKTATSQEDMLKLLDKLVENLYVRGEMGWIRQNVTAMEEDKEKAAQNKKAWEDGLSRFKQALLDYKQQNIALSVALERNGLPATPAAMNAAISYAAQQYAEVTALLEDGQERVNAQTDDGKYSLRTLPDGRKYVEVDTDQDIFEGQPESRYGAIARNYIRDHFRNKVIGEVNKAYVRRDSENEFTNPAVHDLPQELYNNKMRTTTELPNILDAGRLIGEKPDDGRHGPDKRHHMRVEKWINYDVLYKVGNRWYEGETKIAKIAKGNIFHDITQIKDVTQQILTDYAEAQHQTENVSDAIISNSGEKVNHKFSLPTQPRQEADAADWVRDDAELYAQLKQDPDARAALWMIERIYRNTTTGEGRTVLSEADLNKRLPEVVKRLKEQTGATVSNKEMTKQIMTLWEALQKPGYQMGEMMQYARNMIKRWIESAPGVMAEQDETTKEILQALKHPFSLTPDMKSEIKGTFGDARDFYRKNFGKLKINNKALSTLADVWQETLTKLNPGVFAPDATEADMPIILDAWLETAGKREVSGEFGANIGAMSTDLAMNTILELFNTPDIMQTRYEMNKARVDRTYQLYQAAERLVATVREGYKQKYDEKIHRYRDTRDKQAKRDSIARSLRAINSMTVKPTDRRHVPMELKEMAGQALDALLNGKSGFSKEKLTMLENEYRKLEGRKGALAGWEQETLERIEWLAENLDGKSLKELSLEELGELGKLVGNLHHMMIDQNKAFIEGREVDIDQYNEQFDIDMKSKKEVNKDKAVSAAREFRLKNTTPVYFADQAGGVIKSLINNLFHGQRTAYRVAEKGHDLLGALGNNYHVNNWINDKTVKEITTEQGHKIKLDRRLALELAALWNREINSGDTKSHHLRIGGFTYKQSAADRLKMDTTTAHRLTNGDMAQITAWLGKEQMEFMNAVVSMLSNEIGAEGNKVSLRLHGYEKFGEKNYYPYATDKRFTSTELTNTDEREGQPKNKSFTKALTRYAMTPVAAGDFMDTVTGHINDMAIYCGFAETADVANRLMNRRVMGMDAETGEILDAESNWVKMEKAMGKEAVSYLRTLFKDVGGGIRADERGPWAKGLSQFKKASVAGNLSVWAQQFFAYNRAGAMVNAGYLTMALNPVKLGGYIDRMYKHSEVAGIKKIGKFDTGTGKSMAQWIGESVKDPSKYKRVMNALDEKVFGIGAEKADEWAWGFLWGAIEKEITHTTSLKYGSAEYWEAVSDRFEDVVNHTQVYDSVLTKSELMRSNNFGDKMATSFMAEPTLSANMLTDSIVRFNEKGMGAKQVARNAGTFLFTALLTALAKAVPGAWRRKKDEGRTFGEKWLAEAVENFTYDISPAGLAGMIPWARDVISLFEGYDVARSDMDAMEQIVKAMQTLTNDKATLKDKIQNSVGAVANLFGVPAKNVWRDVEGIIRNLALGESSSESRSSAAAMYTVLESLNLEPFGFWDNEAAAYYDRMAQSMIKGDMNQYMELREYMEGTRQTNPKTIDNGLKNRIYSAVDKGLLGEKKAVEMLGEFFDMKEDTAFYAIDKYREGQEHKDEEEWEYNKLGNVMEAVTAGKEIPKEEKQKLLDHGYTELELVQAIETEIGKLYKDGDVTKAEAEKMLRRYADMKDADEIYFDFDKWDYQKQQTRDDPNYSKYVDLDTAIRKGKSTDAAMKELTDHGFEIDTIKSHMKETIGDMYKEGKLTKDQAKEKLKSVVGIEDRYTLYWAFDKWDYQLKNAADRNAPTWNQWMYLKAAINSGDPQNIQKTVKDIYVASDTFKSTIGGAITREYKQTYIDLYNSGRKAEAADLKAKLLVAYQAAGYKREDKNKDINDWVTPPKKKPQEHVKD